MNSGLLSSKDGGGGGGGRSTSNKSKVGGRQNSNLPDIYIYTARNTETDNFPWNTLVRAIIHINGKIKVPNEFLSLAGSPNDALPRKKTLNRPQDDPFLRSYRSHDVWRRKVRNHFLI